MSSGHSNEKHAQNNDLLSLFEQQLTKKTEQSSDAKEDDDGQKADGKKTK